MTGETLLTCHSSLQTLTAPVPLSGVTAAPVLGPVVTPLGGSSCHPTGVQDRGTARSSPGTVVVTVLLRPTLRPSVDSSQLGIADRGFVVLATDVRLVGVDTRSSRGSVTLRTPDRAAVREPEAGLAVMTCRRRVIADREECPQSHR